MCACMYIYSRGNPVIGDVDMKKDIGGFVTVLCVVQTLIITKINVTYSICVKIEMDDEFDASKTGVTYGEARGIGR